MKVLFLSDFLPVKGLRFDRSFEKLIQESDYVVFNLEGSPLLENEKDKKYQIMPFQIGVILSFIKKFGKEKFIIALANNHILDNGFEAFYNLINRLEAAGIAYFGTKEKPYIVLDNELGILNFVTAETVATLSGRKVLNYLFYDKKNILSQIKELRDKQIPLVFYPHWGRDMDRETFNTYGFRGNLKDWLVFGHHPHLISGVEVNDIYSLGNTFIPHPNYYKRFEGVRFGLAVLYDALKNSYDLNLTEVKSKDGFDQDFTLTASEYKQLPKEVLNYDRRFSKLRKGFLKLFAFKNTKFDIVKLYLLQFIALMFDWKAKFKKKGHD